MNIRKDRKIAWNSQEPGAKALARARAASSPPAFPAGLEVSSSGQFRRNGTPVRRPRKAQKLVLQCISIDGPPTVSYHLCGLGMRAGKFQFERECLGRGLRRIAGADEAGRGPLAGPVVAAVVCLPGPWIEKGLPRPLRGLNDSKQLSEPDRERYYEFLVSHPDVSFAVREVDAAVIDAINILQASLRAMREALEQLAPVPDHTLVDGPHIFSARCPQTPLIGGDGRSFSIAAASVIAKVTRDRLMSGFDPVYPEYGFKEHKGYPTPRHLAAIREHGPCPIHRRSFAPFRPKEPELFA